MVDRKVNTPSSFQFKVVNTGGDKVATYTVDDKVDFHVGTEPLYQHGSLSALNFASDSDYIDVGDHDSLEPQNFTISMWVTSSDWGSSGLIYGGYYSGNKGVGIYSNTTAQGSILWIGNGTTKYYSNWGNNPLPIDTIIHIAVIKDGTNVSLYYNGTLIKSSVLTDGTIDYSGGNIRYIGRGLSSTYGHRGIIDDVRIYDIALSATNISDLYNVKFTDTTNLIGHWKFDEGYGSTATDSGIGSNNGAINGASWVNPKIMTGIIMDIDLERNKYGDNNLIIRGEDYLTVLGERLARASFPGAVDISTVLINLITEFASGEYSTVGVSAAGVTVTNFTSGAETTLLALMRRLADLPGSPYDFYIDGGNDIVWHPRASASWDSGVTLNENNIHKMMVNRSIREKKTFIKITGAQTPSEEAINRQSTVTDSVTLETNYYADDFIAQHDNLMAVDLYLQKIGTPAADLTGRLAISKYGMPAGDFLAFTLREEDVGTDAGWYRIPVPMDTQVGSRYFIRLDKAGSNSSNTYKWYGDAPSVLDTERKAKLSTDGIYWTEYDGDLAMKIYYGEYAEVTALDASTPRRDAVVPLPSNSGIDDVLALDLAEHILANYLQTAFKATVRFVAPAVELKPSYLITLDEAGDGLASKAYRVERVKMEFGSNRACDYYDVDISATLPYTYLGEEDSILREALLSAGTGSLKSGVSSEITTAKVGFAKVDYSYTAIYPDEG